MKQEEGVFADENNEKLKKGVYIFLNLLFMIPVICRYYSLSGAIWSAVLLAVSGLWIIFGTKSEISGCNYILTMLSLNMVIFVILEQTELKRCFDVGVWTNTEGTESGLILFVFMLLAGMIFFFIGFVGKAACLFLCLGGGMFGSAFILQYYSNFDFSDLRFEEGGQMLFIVFLIGVLVWAAVLKISSVTVNHNYIMSIILTSAATIFWSLFFVYEKKYVLEKAEEWKTAFLYVNERAFAWWKILLLTLIFIALIYYLYKKEGNTFSVDQYFLIILTSALFVTKIYISCYFPYGWMLILLCMMGLYLRMKHRLRGEKCIDCGDVLCVWAIPFLTIAALILFYMGLWMNVVVTVLFSILWYEEKKGCWKEKKTAVSNYIIPAWIAAEVAAWAWKFRNAPEEFLMIAIMTVFAACGIWIIRGQYLEMSFQSRLKKICEKVICVTLCALCAAAAAKYGSRIHAVINQENQTVKILMEARGKNNEVTAAYYYWTDSKGRRVTEDIAIEGAGTEIPLTDEVLTIVVRDAKGILTTRHAWNTVWYLNRPMATEEVSQPEALPNAGDVQIIE